MKVFYSWQSDSENKYNRSFIKNALEKSIKQLNRDLEINEPDRQIHLDHDTKNTPGTPNLAETIFEKIAASTVFIADISFIAERCDDNGKIKRRVANPNVLIELGFALSTLGSDKVICILNSSTGSVDDLPFDLRHKRYPIQYSLDADNISNTDRNEKQNQFINVLKVSIKNIIDLEPLQNGDVNISEKPTKYDIIRTIISSDSKEDWGFVRKSGKNSGETRYFKKNVNLRFEMGDNEDSIQCKDFNESWANKHPDPKATGYWCHLYFGSTHIDTFILVSVDGGRACLPLPESANNLVVKPLYYKVAQIFDQLDTLDEYMIRSNLTIEGLDIDSGLSDGSGFGFGTGCGEGYSDGSGIG